MATAACLLCVTVVLWLLFCIGISFFGQRIKHKYPATAVYLGGAALLLAAVCGWSTDSTFTVTSLGPFTVYLGVAPMTLRFDGLAAIFTGLLGILTMAAALFSPGYLHHLDQPQHHTNKGAYWVQLIVFITGMLGVLTAANGPTFLVSWEVMALSSALLIAANLSSSISRRAAFIYLAATRIATAFLTAGFLWMYCLTGSWDFRSWLLDVPAATAPALLMLIAFCIKGGIWPFHEWLPYAHPAAPAPVSALMSGIMIKVALYAMIRIFIGGSLGSPWLIFLMLALGLITAFWGILCALMQQDIKSLLAYSSIENAGLILIAVSAALLSLHLNFPAVASISLAAAIFHIFNHGLFKALLFLGAGTIDCRLHTRDIELMGGLGKRMPGTKLCFILGGAAICSLPPLNGFSSKWLIYQSLFHLAHRSDSLWVGGLAVACIAILGLVSGMSLYCFTKVIGISFLGRSRSHAAASAEEGSEYMLASQVMLVCCCIATGLLAPFALTVIQPACASVLQNNIRLTPFYTIPMSTFAMITVPFIAVIYTLWLRGKEGEVRSYITWDCGFGGMTKRMQGTATSFTENIGKTFAPLLEYDAHTVIVGRDRRHFPETIKEEARMTSILEAHVYGPAVKGIHWLGERLMHLQAGTIHQYLGFIVVTLVVLLLIGILI